MITSIQTNYTEPATVEFQKLPESETFMYGSNVYKKISLIVMNNQSQILRYNAINLSSLIVTHMDNDARVQPVDVEVTLDVFDKDSKRIFCKTPCAF